MENGEGRRTEEELDLQVMTSEQTSWLRSENKELRSRVSLLESGQRQCEQLAREWQNFGQYTANVLKNEIATYEVKVQLLREQVEKLSRENKELKEMCLYLDRSGNVGDETKLTPPETAAILLHSSIMSKLNKRGASSVPRFSGMTSHNTLKDEQGRSQRKEEWSGMPSQEALAEMKKRVDRLEKEKLELIKSLSAAHLLMASGSASFHDSHKNLTSEHRHAASVLERLMKPPTDVGTLSLSFSHERGHESKAKETDKSDNFTLPELAINAATLLDVCRRLDAAEQNSCKDGMEESECAVLRVLLNIAWQKVQEEQLRRNSSVYTATEQAQ